ncbi:MAG TPA: hypothetical protein K8V90_06490 [Romboutsia timonensis]|uniref:Uncharacterized protein n=1 Tax=Romboutsia timonensis TaxID=1776391 RepID=A0A921N0Y3_9FIRM|nr:hypothetical protein [Romboutsia timonensis]
MKNYDSYRSDINSRLLIDGKKIFEKQLKGLEGKAITIDDGTNNHIIDKACVYNSLNATSTTKEDRVLNTRKDTFIEKGCYIFIENEKRPYLVLSEIDDHYIYNSCVIRRCPLEIKISEDIIIPCIAEGESYGVKLTASNDFITDADTKIKVTVQSNSTTRNIPLNTRFILGFSEHGVYKISDVTVYNEGMLTYICKKDDFREGYDDLTTGIAYNGDLPSIDEPTTPIEYTISGADSIRKGQTETYTIRNPDGTWEIEDYSDSVEIISQDSSQIQIKCNVYGDFITLLYTSINDNDVAILAQKDISLVR